MEDESLVELTAEVQYSDQNGHGISTNAANSITSVFHETLESIVKAIQRNSVSSAASIQEHLEHSAPATISPIISAIKGSTWDFLGKHCITTNVHTDLLSSTRNFHGDTSDLMTNRQGVYLIVITDRIDASFLMLYAGSGSGYSPKESAQGVRRRISSHKSPRYRESNPGLLYRISGKLGRCSTFIVLCMFDTLVPKPNVYLAEMLFAVISHTVDDLIPQDLHFKYFNELRGRGLNTSSPLHFNHSGGACMEMHRDSQDADVRDWYVEQKKEGNAQCAVTKRERALALAQAGGEKTLHIQPSGRIKIYLGMLSQHIEVSRQIAKRYGLQHLDKVNLVYDIVDESSIHPHPFCRSATPLDDCRRMGVRMSLHTRFACGGLQAGDEFTVWLRGPSTEKGAKVANSIFDWVSGVPIDTIHMAPRRFYPANLTIGRLDAIWT